MKRMTNSELFKQLVDAIGERGKAKLSYEAKCGHSTVEQMYRGSYQCHPSDSLRERICMAFKKLLKKSVSEDALFPLAGEEIAS